MAQIDTSNPVVDGATEIPTANGGTETPVVDGATDTTTNASADASNEIELKRGISAGGIVTDDTGEPGTWGHYSAWCQQ